MNRRINVALLPVLAMAFAGGCEQPAAIDGAGIELRAEHLTVSPSTGPVTHVLVRNLGGRTYKGRVTAKFPPGWKMNTVSQPVTVEPGKTERLPFAIERGTDAADNAYPVELSATGDGGAEPVTRRQTIVCASAPYGRPTVDGKLDDWSGAIPVTFTTAGKRTTVSTHWSRRAFSLLVAVEEDALTPMPVGEGASAFDAVQLALSPRNATTPASASGKAQRYEFVLAATKLGGRCYQMMRPGRSVAVAAQARALTGLELDGTAVSITREGGTTYYEAAIPFKAMPLIRPDPGRELCFSLLVHDAGGTPLRDWGVPAGLSATQRKRQAWCNWRGATRPHTPPMDNKIEWGFCSSKY